MNRLALVLLFLLPASQNCPAQQHWPQFRGPGALGRGEEGSGLPLSWSREENIAWKVPVPGMGWSSPVIWGDRVFLTTVRSEGEVEEPRKGLYFGGERPEPPEDIHHWMVRCHDFSTGALLWSTTLHSGRPTSAIHIKNTLASETPVTDGKHLYVYFGYMGLYSLDFEGKVVWKRTWDAYSTRLGWGTSASPVLHGDVVHVVNDNMDGKSYIAAHDKGSGEEIWRRARDEPSNFSTPFVWENEVRTEIVTTGVNRTRSYDLSGNLLWEFSGMSSICIPTPFADAGLLYVCAGYVGDRIPFDKPVYAIRPGAAGDITPVEGREQPSIAWREAQSAPYNPSPLVYRNRLYVLWDFGFLSCRDSLTGREIYGKQRVRPRQGTAFTASPWAYEDRVFCLSEEGDTHVFAAGDIFTPLQVNSLGEMCMATPAMARGSLFIRSDRHLYRIASP